MPIAVSDAPLLMDVLAIAFVKSVALFIGPRGDGSIIKLSLGLKKHEGARASRFLEASWCELGLPDTIKELGPSNKPQNRRLYEIRGVVSPTCDMSSLLSLLTLHRAKCLQYHLVSRENNQSAYSLSFVIDLDHKREAIEAFLVKGAALYVTEKVIEHHELNKRMVTIPLGHGNKAKSARLNEYLYLDKCIRVEPVEEDLEAYVKRTDYSLDVARSDLLMAWKKWRGKLVVEEEINS
jgi:hypothetical protein